MVFLENVIPVELNLKNFRTKKPRKKREKTERQKYRLKLSVRDHPFFGRKFYF